MIIDPWRRMFGRWRRRRGRGHGRLVGCEKPLESALKGILLDWDLGLDKIPSWQEIIRCVELSRCAALRYHLISPPPVLLGFHGSLVSSYHVFARHKLDEWICAGDCNGWILCRIHPRRLSILRGPAWASAFDQLDRARFSPRRHSASRLTFTPMSPPILIRSPRTANCPICAKLARGSGSGRRISGSLRRTSGSLRRPLGVISERRGAAYICFPPRRPPIPPPKPNPPFL